jgi:hypothetical protein
MRVGETVQVSIVIGGNTISPLGRVVHGSDHPELRYDSGFTFETLHEKDRDYLLSYLAKLSRS